jgi:hypothetical protein
VRVEGRAELPGAAEHGQDHHPARGQPLAQPRRGRDPVEPGQVDIEHREVGTLRQRRRDDVGPGRHLGDHRDVILQVQHRDKRVPQNPHVLRDKDPDHRPSNRADYRMPQSLARTSRRPPLPSGFAESIIPNGPLAPR